MLSDSIEAEKLHDVYLRLIAVWVNLGVRWDTFKNISDTDIEIRNTTSEPEVRIQLTKDKVASTENRFITLQCGCPYAWQTPHLKEQGWCILHPPGHRGETQDFSIFPPRPAHFNEMRKIIKFKDHAARRGAAMAMRILAQVHGASEANLKYHMGWGETSNQWNRYSAKYEEYQNKRILWGASLWRAIRMDNKGNRKKIQFKNLVTQEKTHSLYQGTLQAAVRGMMEPFYQTVKTRKEVWMDPPTSETMEAPNASSVVGNHGRENASVAADIEDLIKHHDATNTATATSSNNTKQQQKHQGENAADVMNDLERLFKLYDKQTNNKSLFEKSNTGYRDTSPRSPHADGPGRTADHAQQGRRPRSTSRPVKKQKKYGEE